LDVRIVSGAQILQISICTGQWDAASTSTLVTMSARLRWSDELRNVSRLIGRGVSCGARAELRAMLDIRLRTAAWLTACTLLAACSGAARQSIPALTQSDSSSVSSLATNRGATGAATKPALVYVTSCCISEDQGVVQIFDQSNTKKGPIQTLGAANGLKLPFGLEVDPAGNLYVTDELNEEIFVFPYGSTTPSATYYDPGWYPDSVATCPDGKLYVGNYAGTTDRFGSVSIYSAGKTKPAKVMTNAAFYSVSGVACDAKNNLYVAYLYTDAGPGYVSEFGPGGSGPGKMLPFSVQQPGSLEIDKAGDFILVDQLAGVDFFHPTADSPFKTFSDANNPLGAVLNSADTGMWVTESNVGTISKINIKTGKLTNSFPVSGGPTDVAAYPPD
jgi:DNA-binding beta-propeller fold protein YncE